MDFIILFEQFIRNKYVQCAIIIFQVVLFVAIVCIRTGSLNKKIKKVQEQYKNREYKKVISLASELKGKYSVMLRFSGKRTRQIYSQLSLMIASASLRIGYDELFHKHIVDVPDQDFEYVVAMWLTVFDLRENNIESARSHYEQFLHSKKDDRKPIAKTFLDALFAYAEGDRDTAIGMVSAIEQDLINPVMKHYVEDMMRNKMNF